MCGGLDRGVKVKVERAELERAGWIGDFDWFRRNYHRLDFEDLKHIYGIWLLKYPEQRYFNVEFFSSCIRHVVKELGRDDLRVCELGGYKGELALEMFRLYPRLDWLNIEIIGHEPVKGLENYSYREHVLSRQIWEENLDLSDRDLFISSDTLEHFTDDEFEKIVDYLGMQHIRFLSLKVPIVSGGQRWDGVSASHLLNMGVEEAKERISRYYVLISDSFGWLSFWQARNFTVAYRSFKA